jgi:hypothetical protein
VFNLLDLIICSFAPKCQRGVEIAELLSFKIKTMEKRECLASSSAQDAVKNGRAAMHGRTLLRNARGARSGIWLAHYDHWRRADGLE